MPPERRHRIAEAMRVTNDLIEGMGHGRNECVFATEVMRRVLRAEGIAVKRLPCRVLILDDEAWQGIGGDLTRLLDADSQARPHDINGRVGVIGKPDAPGWPAHVVLTSRNPDLLIDPTLDQGNAFMEGAALEPVIQEASRADLRAFERGLGVLLGESDTGWAIAWIPLPGVDMRKADHWDDPEIREMLRAGGPFDRDVIPKLQRQMQPDQQQEVPT